MKWVKASARLPTTKNRLYIYGIFRNIYSMQVANCYDIYDYGIHLQLDGSDILIQSKDYEDWEWLDEQIQNTNK